MINKRKSTLLYFPPKFTQGNKSEQNSKTLKRMQGFVIFEFDHSNSFTYYHLDFH